MKSRPDLLDEKSAPGIEVFQLTEETVPSCHVYMEAQIFTPDSKRFVLHRSAHPHGSDKLDPEHRYLLCDVATGEMLPVTTETGTTGPSVSPDGKLLYYFVNETEPTGGRLTLRRRKIDGSSPETICVVDAPLRGTSFRPSQIYPLSTMRSDGKRIAISCYLGDGKVVGGAWGLLVFDIPSGTCELILHGKSWCNMHPQYSRSLDPQHMRDILVQDNHGNQCDASGKFTKLVGGLGADIHVIRDDGQHLRDMPWGRDGNEACQGHQCWRGRSDWAITSTVTTQPKEWQLIESRAVEHEDHDGLRTTGAQRNDLSREIDGPFFWHFATDIEGKRFITDFGPGDSGGRIFRANLGEPGEAPLQDWTYLLNARCSLVKGAHLHPFLSPDGRTGFFNSDESGVLQAYMIRGL